MDDLVERVSRLIRGGCFGSVQEEAEGFQSLLRECVDRGDLHALVAVQRLAELDYEGLTWARMYKMPAAFALACWGTAGLDALVEMTNRAPTKENICNCFRVLSAIVVGSQVGMVEVGYLRDEQLLGRIQRAVNSPELKKAAELRLNKVVLDSPDLGELIGVVGLEFSTWWVHRDLGRVRRLFAALATRWLAVGRPTIAEYERLIEQQADNERAFQSFFERTPQMLEPMALDVWPEPNIVGVKRPDFVVRRSDNSYLVVEIEAPSKRLVTAANQIAADVTHAVEQAVAYREFLKERLGLAREHFPEFRNPDCLVVVGLEHVLTSEQQAVLARMNDTYQRLRVVGFDWIARRAEAIANNIIDAMSAEGRIRVY